MANGSLSHFKATLRRSLDRRDKRIARKTIAKDLRSNTISKNGAAFKSFTDKEIQDAKDRYKMKRERERRRVWMRLLFIMTFIALITILIFYMNLTVR